MAKLVWELTGNPLGMGSPLESLRTPLEESYWNPSEFLRGTLWNLLGEFLSRALESLRGIPWSPLKGNPEKSLGTPLREPLSNPLESHRGIPCGIL